MADDHFPAELTLSATEFKAKCLQILDQLHARKIDRLTITKRGKPVAVVTPPAATHEPASIYGKMRGRVTIPPGFDLTAPVFDGEIDADKGILHR